MKSVVLAGVSLRQFYICWLDVMFSPKKTDYFVRHNAVWKYIHFKILEAFSIPRGENWFVQSLRDVVLGNGVEVICDQIIATDRPEGAHRPDIIVRDLNRKEVGGFGIL